MARNGRGTFTSRSKGLGGRAKNSQASKNVEKQLKRMPPIYANEDLPESVKQVLQVLYPKSKYARYTSSAK